MHYTALLGLIRACVPSDLDMTYSALPVIQSRYVHYFPTHAHIRDDVDCRNRRPGKGFDIAYLMENPYINICSSYIYRV